jgi:hypothetical protein
MVKSHKDIPNHYYGFVNLTNQWISDNDRSYPDRFFDDKNYKDFYFDNFYDMDEMFGHENSLFGTKGLPVGHPDRSSKSFDVYTKKHGPMIVRVIKKNDLQEQIRRVLREELSTRIRRRLSYNEMENEFIESFEEAYRLTKKRKVLSSHFLDELVYTTITFMMDGVHWRFVSTLPEDEFWYDDIHKELENHYRDRITQMYNESKGIKESILREEAEIKLIRDMGLFDFLRYTGINPFELSKLIKIDDLTKEEKYKFLDDTANNLLSRWIADYVSSAVMASLFFKSKMKDVKNGYLLYQIQHFGGGNTSGERFNVDGDHYGDFELSYDEIPENAFNSLFDIVLYEIYFDEIYKGDRGIKYG